MSRAQLLQYEEQARERGKAETLEVLQPMPQAHGAQGDEVMLSSSPRSFEVSRRGFTRIMGERGELCSPLSPAKAGSTSRMFRAGIGGLRLSSRLVVGVLRPLQREGEGRLCPSTPERGRVWEPFPGSHYNRAVAPMVEQRSPKPRVVGSSPSCPAQATWGA